MEENDDLLLNKEDLRNTQLVLPNGAYSSSYDEFRERGCDDSSKDRLLSTTSGDDKQEGSVVRKSTRVKKQPAFPKTTVQ